MPSVLLLGGCGYIGSALCNYLSERDRRVQSVDLELRGNPGGVDNIKQDYRSLECAFLRSFDVIIFLAAHSSVLAAIEDPQGTIDNNIVGFWDLLAKIDEHQQFIYASSGSVYDGYGGTYPCERDPVSDPRNMYDLSKMTNDLLATSSGRQCYGLRFATVSGISPNLRSELILNKMTLDAVTRGEICLANPRAHRSCLGIGDLCRMTEAIISTTVPRPGVYNVSSFTNTIGELAAAIAALTGANVVGQPDSLTYDFSMSVQLITETFGRQFRDSLETIVDELSACYRSEISLSSNH